MQISNEILLSGQSSIYSLFLAQVRRNKKAKALEYMGSIWTYDDLNIEVQKFASILSDRGIKEGDRVAIISENRPEYIVSKLACALLGAIIACQNWRLSISELEHCLKIVDPKLLLISERYSETLSKLGKREPQAINFDREYSKLIESSSLKELPLNIDPESGLIILYTSGTTGLPKGALISHRAEIARMCALRLDSKIDEEDSFVAWAPMFHMASTDQVLGALISGSTVIVIDGFKPDKILDAASRYKLGWLVMLPGSIKPIIEYLKTNKPKLKSIACVGAMADLVPRKELIELTKLLDAPYLNSFGSTETGLPPASAALIQPGSPDYSLSKRVSSMCEVKIVDENGMEVEDGVPGELAIRGPTVFSGYWNSPKTNKSDFFGGWFRMGDMFCRNPDGTIDFVDRAKYMIKSGGENIYPAEIERVLLSDTRISDAVVIKKADEKWGEIPVALIAPQDTTLKASDIETLCRANLASYKRPQEVYFIGLSDFPRSTTGKIQRHEIENWLKNDTLIDKILF